MSANETFDFCFFVLSEMPLAAPFMQFPSVAARIINCLKLVGFFLRMLVIKESKWTDMTKVSFERQKYIFRFLPTTFSSEPSSLPGSVRFPAPSPHLVHTGTKQRKEKIEFESTNANGIMLQSMFGQYTLHYCILQHCDFLIWISCIARMYFSILPSISWK